MLSHMCENLTNHIAPDGVSSSLLVFESRLNHKWLVVANAMEGYTRTRPSDEWTAHDTVVSKMCCDWTD